MTLEIKDWKGVFSKVRKRLIIYHQKVNIEAPEIAAELHTYIVQLLSNRLAKSNATIKALMR
mgnify:CR=1 FL=1|jgi:hypothetical protein